MFQATMIRRTFARRSAKLLLAPVLAASVLVGQTGAVAADSYQQPTFYTTGGGSASGLVSTGYRALQVRMDIIAEGVPQEVGVLLWIQINGGQWGQVGIWKTWTAGSGQTGPSTYYTYGPFAEMKPATYCFYGSYAWLRTSGWATAGQSLGCWKVT